MEQYFDDLINTIFYKGISEPRQTQQRKEMFIRMISVFFGPKKKVERLDLLVRHMQLIFPKPRQSKIHL